MALLRLLAGIGMGAAAQHDNAVAEYAPQRRRSLMITIVFTGFNLGSAAIGFAADAGDPCVYRKLKPGRNDGGPADQPTSPLAIRVGRMQTVRRKNADRGKQ